MKNTEQESATAPKVAILILNWNSWEDTIECLESLYKIDYPNYSVIVLDNHSTNDSITKLKSYANGGLKVKSKYFKYDPKNKPINIIEYTEDVLKTMERPNDGKRSAGNDTSKPGAKARAQRAVGKDEFILVKNKANHGFAKGNNIGMRYAIEVLAADYVLLLNNDTVVEPDFLTKLVSACDKEERVGIVAPVIPYYDNPDKNWFGRGRVSWFNINIAYHVSRIDDRHTRTDYITGCAALIKSDVVRKIGYLKEDLFLYFEDADYSFRARAAGFDLVVVPEARVYHKVSATSYNFTLSKAQYYFSRNRLWFVRKYCPKKYLRLSLMFIIIRLFLASGFFALKRERATVRAILEAYKDGMKFGD